MVQLPEQSTLPLTSKTDLELNNKNNCLISLSNTVLANASICSPLSIVFSPFKDHSPESPKNNNSTCSESEMTPNSNVQLNGNFVYFNDSPDLTNSPSSSYYSTGMELSFTSLIGTITDKPLQTMDTLKPPGYYLPAGNKVQFNGQLVEQDNQGNNLSVFVSGLTSNSPPRSRSIDLSTLRRDIELWSISSDKTNTGEFIQSENKNKCVFQDYIIDNNCIDKETLSTTPTDATSLIIVTKQNRSRSHDPTESAEHILRRPSRIEHLSEIFRYFRKIL